MSQFTKALSATVFVFMASPAIHAADVKVIANPSIEVSSVSTEEIRNVFLETKTSLSDGSRAEPVLAKGGPTHEAFLKKVIGRTDPSLQVYYRSLVFTGKAAMPKSFANDDDVVRYVAKTKGAIGYVSAETSTEGVKTLELK